MEYNHKDFYEYYKANAKKSFKNKKIWKRHYLKVIGDYYHEISKVIVYDMCDLYLGHKMGSILIAKYKSDSTYFDKDGNIKKGRLPVDWIETFRIWKEDYGDMPKSEYKKIKNKPLAIYFNDHSDGWQYRWFWDKRTSLARNQSKYYFEAVRANKRRLAKSVKANGNLDYPQMKMYGKY